MKVYHELDVEKIEEMLAATEEIHVYLECMKPLFTRICLSRSQILNTLEDDRDVYDTLINAKYKEICLYVEYLGRIASDLYRATRRIESRYLDRWRAENKEKEKEEEE